MENYAVVLKNDVDSILYIYIYWYEKIIKTVRGKKKQAAKQKVC